MPGDYPLRPHNEPDELPPTQFRPAYIDRVRNDETRFLSAFTHDQAILKRIETPENFKEQFAATIIAIHRQMETFNLDDLDQQEVAKVVMLPELFELIISKIEQFGTETDQGVQIANQDMGLWLEILTGFATRYKDKLDNESRAQLQAAIDVLQDYLKVETKFIVENPSDSGDEVDEQQIAQIIAQAEQLLVANPGLFPDIEASIRNIEDSGSGQLKAHLAKQLQRDLNQAKVYLETRARAVGKPDDGVRSRLLGRLTEE